MICGFYRLSTVTQHAIQCFVGGSGSFRAKTCRFEGRLQFTLFLSVFPGSFRQCNNGATSSRSSTHNAYCEGTSRFNCAQQFISNAFCVLVCFLQRLVGLVGVHKYGTDEPEYFKGH